MKEFRLPDPGEGLVEAEIITWRVAEGDHVKVNDILVEIETSKSLVELPSPWEGTVAKLLVAEGTLVDVGAPIVLIDDGTGSAVPSESAAPVTPVAPVAASMVAATPVVEGVVQDVIPAPGGEGREAVLVGYGAKSGAVSRRPRKNPPATVVPATDQVHESYGTDQPVSRPTDEVTGSAKATSEATGEPLPGPGRPPEATNVPRPVLAKPSARKLARDLGVDLSLITPTGQGGLITRFDVEAAAAAVRSVVGAPEVSGDRRIPLRGVRREMARSMTASLKVPQATEWMTVDVTETMRLVEQLKGRREFAGLRISPLLIFAKAACLAISRNPDINSSLDSETEEIIQHADVNLGIAAATPRGLVVPNIKQANRMSLLELAQALNQMVAVAREGRMKPSDMAEGTFTVTNVGIFGIDAGTPILNPGESAIMALGTISRKPWVVGEGADERIEPRWVCTIVLTFDHRLVDGEIGSKFLYDVATIMKDPGLALLF